MRMTREGRRILGFWVGAYLIGGVLTAALWLTLLPVLGRPSGISFGIAQAIVLKLTGTAT